MPDFAKSVPESSIAPIVRPFVESEAIVTALTLPSSGTQPPLMPDFAKSVPESSIAPIVRPFVESEAIVTALTLPSSGTQPPLMPDFAKSVPESSIAPIVTPFVESDAIASDLIEPLLGDPAAADARLRKERSRVVDRSDRHAVRRVRRHRDPEGITQLAHPAAAGCPTSPRTFLSCQPLPE